MTLNYRGIERDFRDRVKELDPQERIVRASEIPYYALRPGDMVQFGYLLNGEQRLYQGLVVSTKRSGSRGYRLTKDANTILQVLTLSGLRQLKVVKASNNSEMAWPNHFRRWRPVEACGFRAKAQKSKQIATQKMSEMWVATCILSQSPILWVNYLRLGTRVSRPRMRRFWCTIWKFYLRVYVLSTFDTCFSDLRLDCFFWNATF